MKIVFRWCRFRCVSISRCPVVVTVLLSFEDLLAVVGRVSSPVAESRVWCHDYAHPPYFGALLESLAVFFHGPTALVLRFILDQA